MKGQFWRKALAAALALLIVSGSTPIQSLSQVFEDIAITASAEGTNVDLAVLTGDYTAQDGDVLTGSTSGTITIANNAKITLSDVTITGGIVCSGTAEITLVGTNSVSGATNMAGIQVGGSGTTLTIKGNGSLTANGGGNSAGIGLSRAWKVDATGGDIVIEGGNITATGKGMGAGIGTGVSFGDDANHTATIGNITIKGGTVTAIGGTNQYFPGSGIGKGGAYSYGNTVVGTVTITTNIDLVNASSISEIVTYKHGETDVTSIASDYFTINEDGDRRIIVPNDDTEYNVTIAEEITGGTVTADKTTAKAGDLVALTVTQESGYVLQSLTVKDASDNDVSLSNRKFIMPKGGATVSATFIQTTAAFDEATGVLTLNGNVVADEVKAYGAIIGDYGAIVKESPVTSVVCEPGTVLPADCSELFLNYTNSITIDLSNADISGVTNMSKMFGSQSLTTIYVNSAWSMENVTSSDQMFYGCNLLRGGNGSRWEDVRVAVWKSNGNDLEEAKAKASRSSYAIIDGKGGLPGYLTVKPKQTPSAPTANVITYTGEAQELVSAGDGTMLYSLDDGIYSAEIPTATAAGTYTVHYKVDGSDNWNAVIAQTVEVTIAKATPTVTAPTANTLTYNGNEQELVTAGSTDFGKVLYSLDGTNYSEDIPKATDAGIYTVYYKVEGSDNWNAVDAATVEVTIAESYTITWKNGDEIVETDNYVPGGATPEYNGTTPTKPKDADYIYTFSGWSPEISSVEGDIIYTAQFTATARRGDCGANATWCFDPDTGKLTISGTGDMTDYNTPHYVPWYDIRNNIKSVIIENGITDIGRNAFYTCTSLESVTIPDSVTSIGECAFADCKGLTSITIPASVTSIGLSAFQNCTGLTSIEIPKNVTSIGEEAFYNCTNITDVYCYAAPANLTWNDGDCDDFIKTPKQTTVCHVPAEYLDTYNSEKFSDVNVRFVGDLVDMGLGEHLYGHSITLDGSIGVNFYVELTDELLASENAEMVFTVPNGSETDTQTLLVKDVIADDSNKVSIGSKTYYKFKCSISAKDMASTITAQLVDGESKGKEYTYSVKDYADYLLEHTEGNAEYAKAAPLVKAMLNYGAASQTYFGIEGTAANASLTDVEKALGEVSIPDTFKFDEANADIPEDVTFEGATLSLKSETTLSLYFKGLAEDTEFTCDSKTVETAKNGEYVVARIRGINASELENDFTVTFEGDSVTYNVTYNVMTYFYNVLNDDTVDDNLKNVCKALYKYAQAAKTYSE